MTDRRRKGSKGKEARERGKERISRWRKQREGNGSLKVILT